MAWRWNTDPSWRPAEEAPLRQDQLADLCRCYPTATVIAQLLRFPTVQDEGVLLVVEQFFNTVDLSALITAVPMGPVARIRVIGTILSQGRYPAICAFLRRYPLILTEDAREGKVTILQWCIRNGLIEQALFLIQQGTYVDANYLAAHRAAAEGKHWYLFARILERSNCLGAVSRDHMAALIQAIAADGRIFWSLRRLLPRLGEFRGYVVWGGDRTFVERNIRASLSTILPTDLVGYLFQRI